MDHAIFRFGCVCGLMLGVVTARAQTAPDANINAALRSLGTRAAVVFAGEVTAIRRVGGVVEVEFRVDQTVKGPASGSYVLREWLGLWAAGQRRYWVGERAVVFLHQAVRGGLSSPVDGMEGILPLAADSSSPLAVDVERLRTRIVRAVRTPMTEAGVPMRLSDVASAVLGEPPTAPSPLPRPRPVPRPVRPLPVQVRPYQIPTALPEQDSPGLLLPDRQTHRAVGAVDGIR